jgi:NAD(P)-dependent dehydrogenase (short-subunit alcohol dehydrogenase family)
LISPDQRLYNNLNKKPVSYSVVKHGIIGLTKYISTYWADKGIRANTLCPGGVLDNQPDEFLIKIKNLIPLNRMADRDEYKSAIQFLSSDASSYMNGASIVIDGGRSSW